MTRLAVTGHQRPRKARSGLEIRRRARRLTPQETARQGRVADPGAPPEDAAMEPDTDLWERTRTVSDLSAGPGIGAELFDPEYFGLDDAQAAALPCGTRHLLEVCCEALDDAGRTTAQDRTGLFLFGACADTVARVLTTRGPSVTLSGASHGLQALVLAAHALRRGDCTQALIGVTQVDGSAPGGTVVLVARRVADARADGDRIHGVLRGHCGSSGETLAEIVARTLEREGLDMPPLWLHAGEGALPDLGASLAPSWSASTAGVLGAPGPLDGLLTLVQAILTLRHRLVPRDGAWSPPPMTERLSSAAVTAGGEHPRCVIVGGGPEPHSRLVRPIRAELLTLSAPSAGALQARIRSLVPVLSDPDLDLGDLCHTLGARRPNRAHRVAVIGESGAEVLALLDGRLSVAPQTPSAALAFIFTGVGGQVRGMGQQLARTEPAFAGQLEQCAEAITDPTVRSAVVASDEPPSLDDLELAVPAIVAHQMATTALLRDWGFQPAAVSGVGVGEISAAWAAGIFTTEAAMKLAVAWGRTLARALDPAAPGGLLEVLGAFTAAPPTISSLSAFSGGSIAGRAPDEWPAALRDPAQLAEVLSDLPERGFRFVIELGGQPLLGEAITAADSTVEHLATGRPGREERRSLLEVARDLYLQGFTVAHGSIHGEGVQPLTLPPIPWNRRDYTPAPVAPVVVAPEPAMVDRIPAARAEELIRRQLDLITEQLALIRMLSGSGEVEPPVEPEPEPTRTESTIELATTSTQRLMMELAPMSGRVNPCMVLQLDGTLDIEGLGSALRSLTARHEALRTHLSEDGTQQSIDANAEPAVSLREISPARVEEVAEELAASPIASPSVPPWRALLLRHGGRRHSLVTAFSPSILDRRSLAVLARELMQLYGAVGGTASPALPVPRQYREVSVASGGADRRYWERALSGMPKVWLGSDGAGERGRVLRRAGPGLCTAVEAYSVTTGLTPWIAWLGGFSLLLHRQTHARDLLVGAVPQRRQAVRDASVVGPLGHFPLPVRSTVTRRATLVSHVRALSTEILEMEAHGTPPADLEPELAAAPFTATFTMDAPARLPTVGGVSATMRRLPLSFCRPALCVHLAPGGGGLDIELEHDRGALSSQQVGELFEAWLTLMSQIFGDPDASVYPRSEA